MRCFALSRDCTRQFGTSFVSRSLAALQSTAYITFIMASFGCFHVPVWEFIMAPFGQLSWPRLCIYHAPFGNLSWLRFCVFHSPVWASIIESLMYLPWLRVGIFNGFVKLVAHLRIYSYIVDAVIMAPFVHLFRPVFFHLYQLEDYLLYTYFGVLTFKSRSPSQIISILNNTFKWYRDYTL